MNYNSSYLQYNYECGLICILVICEYYCKHYSREYINSKLLSSNKGTTFFNIIIALEQLNFDAFAVELSYSGLIKYKNLFPAILHCNKNHFVTIFNITGENITLLDPAVGVISTFTKNDFLIYWCGNNTDICTGNILFALPKGKYTT